VRRPRRLSEGVAGSAPGIGVVRPLHAVAHLTRVVGALYVPWYIEIMRTATFSEARANLARTWDHVVDDAEPIMLTRVGREPVVMVALAEYESMRETMYLRRSPRMAERIDAAIARFEAGEGVEHELIEP